MFKLFLLIYPYNHLLTGMIKIINNPLGGKHKRFEYFKKVAKFIILPFPIT